MSGRPLAPSLLRAAAALLLLLPLLASPAHAGGGFGVSPSDIDFGEVVRGEPMLRTIEVQNGGDAPARVSVAREGLLGEATRLENESFVVPPHSTFPMRVRFEPEDIPNGRQTGALIVRLAPEGAVQTGSGANVALAVRVDLSALVGGVERKDFAAGDVHVSDAEAGQPLLVSVVMENRGNVRAMPVLNLVVSTPDRQVVQQTSQALGTLLPGETRNDTVRVEAPGRPGQYRLDATVRESGVSIHLGPRLFEVVEPGTLRRKLEVGSIATADLARVPNHRLPADAPFLIQVPVRNVGEAHVEASFEGSLLRDGVLVRALKSDAWPLDAGESAVIRLQQEPLPAGTYVIRGEVRYEGRVTEGRETVLMIEPSLAPPKARSIPGMEIPLLLLAAAALALLRPAKR